MICHLSSNNINSVGDAPLYRCAPWSLGQVIRRIHISVTIHRYISLISRHYTFESAPDIFLPYMADRLPHSLEDRSRTGQLLFDAEVSSGEVSRNTDVGQRKHEETAIYTHMAVRMIMSKIRLTVLS
jgi:hypothetical protein